MNSKIDVCIVVDKSGSLRDHTETVNSALRTMIYELKTSEDLYGIDVYLTVVAFDDKEKVLVDFQNLKTVDGKELKLTFGGTTNPAPALNYVVDKTMARYEDWKHNDEEPYHPLIFFFTDGNPYPAENFTEYEKIAALIRKYEAEKKILVVSAGFGEANIENISKLTNYKERVLKPKNNSVERLAEFFEKIIPVTTKTATTTGGEISQLNAMFHKFNNED